MVKAKKWILARHFVGEPKDSDLKLVEETLPAIKDGEVSLEAIYLSVDPYMRGFSKGLKEGDTMVGTQVAKVVESRNPKFAVGSYVVADVGWRTHTITGDENLLRQFPPFGELSLSYALGALGMPGVTAYLTVEKLCQPKKGEVVLVTGAGGAVGSLIVQIAKLKGCEVIAFAGTPEKVRWLKEDLGADVVINYKKVTDQEKAIKEAAPDGVDCFFDNVGGPFYTAGMRNMRSQGRVALIGAISTYNNKEAGQGPYVNLEIVRGELKVQGFFVFNWLPKWGDAIKAMMVWIREGKLTTRETVTTGFANMRSAFYGLFKGDNIGKAVVKV